jgi:hypothetical protein
LQGTSPGGAVVDYRTVPDGSFEREKGRGLGRLKFIRWGTGWGLLQTLEAGRGRKMDVLALVTMSPIYQPK